jgi:hypothetical protein
MPNYGWNEYIDQTGTPCAYCGATSTHTLVLEPDEYKNKELHRRGKRVGVCDKHNRAPEDLPAAMTFRRRKAKGVEQIALDVGDGHGKQQGAIYGDDAA